LGLTHWKAAAGDESDRLARALDGACGLRECDLERKPDHVERTDDVHSRQDGRKASENDIEPKAEERNHQREAENDSDEMRQGSSEAELHARGHQHQIVGTWRDRCNEGENRQGR
jgi:hypothetical protein